MVWIEHIGARLVLPLLGPLELELVASEVNFLNSSESLDNSFS